MVQSVILTGPTAVGKSSLAIEMAARLDLEIINADSVCFYREFDIGSAKPTLSEREQVPHHLIDIADPNEVYHAGQFVRDFEKVLAGIHERGKRALIVGGSGFYLKALRLGLWEAPPTSPEFRKSCEDRSLETLFQELNIQDPVHAKKIGPQDRYRIVRALEILHLSGKKPSELEASMPKEPKPAFSLWVVDRDPTELSRRIRTRIEAMLEAGLVEETKRLRNLYPNSKTLQAVGYAQVISYLDGVKPKGRKIKEGLTGLVDEIELAHRQLTKQQRTFFKGLKPEETFTLDQETSSLQEKLMRFYQ